jgi:F-type H+-transporting ATPase subunit b
MSQLLDSLGIVPIDLASQFVGIIILWWIFAKYLFPPIFSMIDGRQAEIKEGYEQLEADRASMEKTRLEYEAKLAGIENEARTQIATAVKEAQELRANILEDAKKQAETTLEKSRVEAEREREKAFAAMRAEIVELSIQAAGRVINESLDAKKHSALVDDFISGSPFFADKNSVETAKPKRRSSASNGQVGNA